MTSYLTVHAPRSDELSACVQCGLCLPYCPTFRLTGKESASPRGRIAAMRAVLDGVAEVDEAFDEVISFCLGCRACEAVCPGLVPYGRMLEGARAEIVAQRPDAGRRIRGLGLGRLLPRRALVDLASRLIGLAQRLRLEKILPSPARRGLAGLRRLGRRESWVGRTVDPDGPGRGTVMLLAGCVMDDWFGPVHDATVELIRRAGFRIEVPAGQTCCGALAAHDGHADDASRLAAQNVDAFASADVVVSDAAGCTAHLKGYGHIVSGGAALADKAQDVTEFVASLVADGSLPALEPTGVRVAVQDPCHLRHAQRVVDAPRAILRAAGLTPVEIDPDGLCCGAAGIYSILRPDASAELGRMKADQVHASGAPIVASANPGCEMQLRTHLDGVRVAHPVELYLENIEAVDEGRYASAPR